MLGLRGIGLWSERRTPIFFGGRPAIFLDRDGVIIQERHFLKSADGVELTLGIGSAIAAANQADIAVVMITNQSGIARNLLAWRDFSLVQRRLHGLLLDQGANIDLVLACGYHPDGIGELAKAHPWRKPSPGMLEEAARQLGIVLRSSLVVGDRLTDIQAGHAAGLRHGALVRTGYGNSQWQTGASLIAEICQSKKMNISDTKNGADAIIGYLAMIQ